MSEDIRIQLLNVEKIGNDAFQKYRIERHIEKTVRLSGAIHRNKLKTFSTIRTDKESVQQKGKRKVDKMEDAYMKRTLEIAKHAWTMDVPLQYDVSAKFPLFDNERLMKKPVKSEIVHELESYLSADDPKTPILHDSQESCYIVDVMANIRKLQTSGCKNFHDLCTSFLEYVGSITKGSSRTDLIFDSYLDRSLKDSEQRRREKKSAIELHDVSRETPLPREMDRFWPSSANKIKLEALIHREAFAINGTSPSADIVVSHFLGPGSISFQCLSKKLEQIQVPELRTNVEEADVRIIPHAMHTVRGGKKYIVVLSSDTYVLVLLVYYWRELNREGLAELWIKAGVGNSTSYIPIHILAKKTGCSLCQVLPAVHTLRPELHER